MRFSGKFLSTIAICLSLAACAGIGGLGSMSKTQEVSIGMTVAQVTSLLGSPVNQQFIAGRRVLKYSFHQYFKGWVPYYAVFDPDTDLLASLYADEEEYLRTQYLWINAFR